MPLVVLDPLALWRSAIVVRAVVVLALTVGAVRFLPGMVGLPTAPAADGD